MWLAPDKKRLVHSGGSLWWIVLIIILAIIVIAIVVIIIIVRFCCCRGDTYVGMIFSVFVCTSICCKWKSVLFAQLILLCFSTSTSPKMRKNFLLPKNFEAAKITRPPPPTSLPRSCGCSKISIGYRTASWKKYFWLMTTKIVLMWCSLAVNLLVVTLQIAEKAKVDHKVLD